MDEAIEPLVTKVGAFFNVIFAHNFYYRRLYMNDTCNRDIQNIYSLI